LLHSRQGEADRVESRRQVERDDQVPAIDRELIDRRDMLHASIVDEDIDPAEIRLGLAEQLFDRLGPGQIGIAVRRLGSARTLQFLPDLLDLGGIAEAVQHDARPFRRERPRAGEADARSRAGDESGLSLEEHGWAFLR
jgi:hypothetical protein